jgi:hypothetical protein
MTGRTTRAWIWLSGALVLAWTSGAIAQSRPTSGGNSGGSFSGGGGGGGFSGNSFGGGSSFLGGSSGGFSGGSFSGSSFSGGSFSGGSFSGSSFSGGSFSGGSFSGGSFSGGGYSGGGYSGGGFSGGGFSGGSSTNLYQGISNTNMLQKYYGSPTAMGIAAQNSTNAQTPRFGVPVYGTQTQYGSTGTNNSLTGNQNASAGGTLHKPTPYITGNVPPPSVGAASGAGASRLRAEVAGVLGRSSVLSSKQNIRVGVEGQTVVLQGTVSDEGERRLAESLIRFSPGVYAVRNELRVGEPAPEPPRGP